MGLAKQSVQIFLTKGISILLMAVVGVVTARVLGPSGKGLYVLATMIPVLLGLAASIGMSVAIPYFMNQKKHRPSEFFCSVFCLSLVLGGAGVVIVWLFKDSLQATVLKSMTPELLVLALAATLVYIVWNFGLNSILIGRLHIMYSSIILVAQGVLMCTLTFIFLVSLRMGVKGGVLAMLLSYTVAGVLTGLLVWRLEGCEARINPGLVKDLLGFGWRSYLSHITMHLNYRLDRFIINFFVGTAGLGYYSVAVSFAELLFSVSDSVRTALLPRIAADSKYGNITTAVVCRHVIMISLVAGGVMLVAAKPLVSFLYTPAFLPAIRPFFLLLPGVIMMNICRILYVDLAGRGKPIFTAYSSLVGLAFTIILDIALIPRWGIAGAAVASTIAYTASAIFALIAFHKVSGLSPLEVFKIRRKDLLLYCHYWERMTSMIRA
ncbi:MAG TPA: oligosaccharide flippase family protein [Armatimonadota bacterium]|nr:oligosaccharide flippase family protein [Armatimonadota bacterium]